jgi:uncharacterized repeat protein (TIGR02543 family)
MSQARNTSGVYLMFKQKTENFVAKLYDIKDFPDLIPEAQTLDATTLTNSMKIYIEDIKDSGGALAFTINYNKADVTRIKALADAGKELDFEIWVGENDALTPVPTATDGAVSVSGKIGLGIPGGAVSAVMEAVVRIYPTTDMVWNEAPIYTLQPPTHTITFNANGGDAVAPISGIAGATITLPTPTKTAAPNTFDGWFTDDSTFANQFTATTMPAQDTTLFAKWS